MSDRPIDPRFRKSPPRRPAAGGRRDRQLAVARALLAGPLRRAEVAAVLGWTVGAVSNLMNGSAWFRHQGTKTAGAVYWHLTDAGRVALGEGAGGVRPPRVAYADVAVYEDDEAEFLLAVERFRREAKRAFPTATEYLAVLKGLGYRKEGGRG